MWWVLLTLNPDQVTEIVRMQVQGLHVSIDYAKFITSQARSFHHSLCSYFWWCRNGEGSFARHYSASYRSQDSLIIEKVSRTVTNPSPAATHPVVLLEDVLPEFSCRVFVPRLSGYQDVCAATGIQDQTANLY
jgi:hypothetical protein